MGIHCMPLFYRTPGLRVDVSEGWYVPDLITVQYADSPTRLDGLDRRILDVYPGINLCSMVCYITAPVIHR